MYHCGRTFQWVFVGNSQPHRFLLRVFRAQVPKEVRESILQAEVSRIIIQDSVNPSYVPHYARRYFGFGLFKELRKPETLLGYLGRSYSDDGRDGLMGKVKQDVDNLIWV
jgi:hypothetical protein